MGERGVRMYRPLQSTGMLSRQQLIQLFDDFSLIVSEPDVKKRIEDAVQQKQEAVAVTTEIQEELLAQMGVEPKFGIACLGKVNAIYKDDRELMLRFYAFVTKEELACDEAELGSHAFQLKMQQFEKIQDQVGLLFQNPTTSLLQAMTIHFSVLVLQQLQVLQQLRGFPIKDQQAFLEKLHDHMQQSQYEHGSSLMESVEIQEFLQKQQMSLDV